MPIERVFFFKKIYKTFIHLKNLDCVFFILLVTSSWAYLKPLDYMYNWNLLNIKCRTLHLWYILLMLSYYFRIQSWLCVSVLTIPPSFGFVSSKSGSIVFWVFMQIMNGDMEHSKIRNRPLWGTTGGSFFGSVLSVEPKSCIPVIRQAGGSSVSAACCLCSIWQAITAPDSCFFICNWWNWSSHQHPLRWVKKCICLGPPSYPQILIQMVCGGPRAEYF